MDIKLKSSTLAELLRLSVEEKQEVIAFLRLELLLEEDRLRIASDYQEAS